MAERKFGKKIISFVLIMSMLFMSFMVNSTCYADTVYDFSDEAQAKFDSQEYIIIKRKGL